MPGGGAMLMFAMLMLEGGAMLMLEGGAMLMPGGGAMPMPGGGAMPMPGGGAFMPGGPALMPGGIIRIPPPPWLMDEGGAMPMWCPPMPLGGMPPSIAGEVCGCDSLPP